MPILFISLNESFNQKMKLHGYECKHMKIQDYEPIRKTYYVSPTNSLCFMDGGIDYALSHIIFPNIQTQVKHIVKELNIRTLMDRTYLPIGSSIIIDKGMISLVIAPTMLLPQNVSNTSNAYYATMAVLYNVLINKGEDINDVDIIFTSMCCGYGKMDEELAVHQIIKGIHEYMNYRPIIMNSNVILKEPNLYEQPTYHQNREFMNIDSSEMINQT
jgi:O-acetyl-ADP-ribose deacetylase (regulator of RNase III)